MKLHVILILACSCFHFVYAAKGSTGNAPLEIGKVFRSQELSSQISYHYAAPGESVTTYSAGDWRRVPGGVVSETQRGSVLWLRLVLHNASAIDRHLVLVSGEPRTDRVNFYLFRGGKQDAAIEAGDLLLRTSPPSFISAVFRFSLHADETTTILMALSNPVEIATDFTLFTEQTFSTHAAEQYLIQGIFFGVLLVLLLYYGAMYVATRTREVEAYLSYLLVINIFMLARTGLLYQLTAYRWADIMNIAVTPLPALIYAAGFRFARIFLELKKGRIDLGLRIAQYLVLLPIPVAVFSRALSREMCDWITLIASPGLVLVVAALWRKAPKAKLFLLGWCWPIFASLVQYTGADSSFAVRNTLLEGAMLIEFAFFAIFVGRDIRIKERERNGQRLRLETMQDELEEARKVHATLLPATLPETDHLRLSVFYRPMSELGGDYYDWVKLDEDRLVVLVADVTGHGLPAALDAAVVRIAFQSSVVEANNAAGILHAMNQKFMQQNVDRCVSAVCIIYSAHEATVQTALAGHPPAILITRDKTLQIGENASLLGFSAATKFVQSVTPMAAGDRLFLATDGAYELPEATDRDDLEDFAGQLLATRGINLREQIERTIQTFDDERRGRQWDDVTLLGLEIL